MNRLMIGPGQFRRDGWMRLDVNPRYEPDFIGSIPPLPQAVKAIYWNEIEWIHGVTSVYPWDAEAVLGEIPPILAVGGKLTLEQPDFIKARERVEWLFGDGSFKNPWHMNRFAYTVETLTALLYKCGFSRFDVLPAQHHLPERDFRIEAYA